MDEPFAAAFIGTTLKISAPFNSITENSKIQSPTDKCVFRYRQSNFRRLLQASDYCRACGYQTVEPSSDNETVLGRSRKLGGAADSNIWLAVANNVFVVWALNFMVRMLLKVAANVTAKLASASYRCCISSESYDKDCDRSIWVTNRAVAGQIWSFKSHNNTVQKNENQYHSVKPLISVHRHYPCTKPVKQFTFF